MTQLRDPSLALAANRATALEYLTSWSLMYMIYISPWQSLQHGIFWKLGILQLNYSLETPSTIIHDLTQFPIL